MGRAVLGLSLIHICAGVDQFEWFDRAWKFVDEKYGRALIASDSITPEEEHELAVEMSELIGLPAEFIEGKHLRIELDTFRKTIMADEGLFTGLSLIHI